VVSGLNAGSNAGINVLYSGTVAAAIEAAFFQRVSIAVSLEYTKPQPDFPRGAEIARRVIEQLIAQKPAGGTLFNVNVPSIEKGPVKGVRVVPQDVVQFRETLDRRTDPRGRVYFWMNGNLDYPAYHPESDIAALADGYVTVTPLQFNLTHNALLERMRGWKLNV
jgi:5'-nucleotidase